LTNNKDENFREFGAAQVTSLGVDALLGRGLDTGKAMLPAQSALSRATGEG
jgi:hypothetical protein